MYTSQECAFNISVSAQSYDHKPTKTETMGLWFTNQSATTDEVVQYAVEGRSFCYNFQPREDGSFGITEKHIDKFISTDALFFDFDKMDVQMTDFIETLSYKPTFGYTSFSNGNDGYRYRLVYAFSQPIFGETQWKMVYDAIGNANQFEKEDKDSGGWDVRPVNQLYYGTKPSAEVYKSYLIYEIGDFEQFFSSPSSNVFPFKNNNIEDVYTSYSQMEKEFSNDYYSMSSTDFLAKYDCIYQSRYLQSLSTPGVLSDNQMYYTYPEGYQEVKRNWTCIEGKRCVQRWKVGQDRKKKLYVSAQIMKHNLPDITLENLVYNLVKERYTYYDNSDKKLTKDVIVGIARNALKSSISLTPSKTRKFSINREYWLKDNMSANQAKQIVRKLIHDEEVLEYYDFDKSVKDNLDYLKQQGVKVGKSYLYEFLKRHSFPFKNKNKNKEDVYTSCSQMENDFQQQVARVVIRNIEELFRIILKCMSDEQQLIYKE